MHGRPALNARRIPVAGAVVALCVTLLVLQRPWSAAPAGSAPPGGNGSLVAYEPLDAGCVMPAAEQRAALRMAYRAEQQAAQAAEKGTPPKYPTPVRMIKDAYPSFAAVAVDPVRNEVVFTDESLFQVLVYDRLDNTPDGVTASKPKRAISGPATNIEFQSGVYLDQKSGEIYAVNNDTRDTTVVFPAGGDGNVEPVRGIHTPHGSFGITVAEPHDEIFVSVQHDASIVTYWKGAGGRQSPIRFIQGSKTKLADPHGLAYDPKEDVIYVANFGSRHDVSTNLVPRTGVPSEGNEAGKENWPLGREWGVPGSGTINAPSISVYRRLARGDEAPVRVIQGIETQMNWPTGIAFDAERGELYVANDMGPSILVFDGRAKGNVAPKRVIKGENTGLANPTSVAIDHKNGELWVANFGGHSGTVYDLLASGNVKPKRTIRSAPPGTPSLMIGNPGAIAFDSTREQILVPN